MINKLKKKFRSLARYGFDVKNQRRLQNKDISIFSSNCVGGGSLP